MNPQHTAWHAGEVVFVLRAPGAWFVLPVPGERPVPVEVQDLLAIIDDPLPLSPGAIPLPPDQLVQAAWTWVGRIRGGRIELEGPRTETAWVSAEDLLVLDAIGPGSSTVAEVAARSGVMDTAARLGRLVDLALVATTDAGTTSEGPELGSPEADVDPALLDELDRDDPEPAPAARRPNPLTRRLRRRSAQRGSPAELAPSAPQVASPTDHRIPVYSVWHRDVGPSLSLGMLTAAARARAEITQHYEIRRPEDADAVLADLATRPGPAVLLCSDYVWSVESNLEVARRALAVNPSLVVVHGGPSCPAYPGDAEDFLDAHGEVAHLLCRGEGEHAIVELLTALVGSLPQLDPDRLAGIAGLTFRHPTSGAVIRTEDRERIVDLDALPSPYLTGEFDHIEPGAWNYAMAIETTRGCPYGCTFCDWGSSTLSRLRKFSLDRVTAELEWAAMRQVSSVNIADANFGILARDVDVAARVAEIRMRTGHPDWVSFTPAKNTTKHLLKIMDILRRADIVPAMSISLQTIDTEILAAVHRSNISTDHYLTLAADYRRHGHPLQSDLLLGVPEQTYETYRRDLQFNLDHEIQVRTWPVQLLPNAPMNDPAYRAEHDIRADEHGIVISTATFDEADRAAMYQLRRAHVIFEVFGLLRHVLRWVQWDRGIDATHVMDHLLDVARTTPERAPHLTWILGYFDLHPAAPGGWSAFYGEVAAVLVEDLAVPDGSELRTVLRLNQFLMPSPGRTFPATIELPHDYVTYYREAARSLYTTGHAGIPSTRLGDHAPASFTIQGDPIELCSVGPQLSGDSRDEVIQGDFYLASTSCYELHSPLTRLLPFVTRSLSPDQIDQLISETIGSDAPAPLADIEDDGPALDEQATAVPVMLRGTR